MAYASDAEFVLRVAGASAIAVDLRTAALADAEAFIDDELFGDKSVRAHCFLAAHFLMFMPSGLPIVLPVSAMSAGEISASFSVSAPPSADNFSSTAPGAQFQAIARTVASYPVSA